MAKEKNVEKMILVNDGVCTIFFKGDRYMPGDEIEVEAHELENKGIESLIHRGDLIIKDNSAATAEIKDRVESKRKKDPKEGKSRKELEDGGEF